MESLEWRSVRPRQARYQAALRPDIHYANRLPQNCQDCAPDRPPSQACSSGKYSAIRNEPSTRILSQCTESTKPSMCPPN